jgi:alpha-tubulin suppressor-like RCC1 family protein
MRRLRILEILLLALASFASATPGTAQATAIAAGRAFTCALDAGGRAFCWGWDEDGQLGAGTAAADRCGPQEPTGPCALAPVPVAGGLRFRAVDAGHEHACALTAEGEAYCWGSNEGGELGVTAAPDVCTQASSTGETRRTPCSRTPVQVATALRFAEIRVDDRYTCGRTADGGAWCWGASWREGRQQVQPVPARIGGELRFRSIDVAGTGACGVSDAGVAYCWTSDEPKPLRYRAPAAFASIAAGWGHACALTAGGEAHCWGDNDHGQLGTGTETDGGGHAGPAPVAGGIRFQRLEAGLLRTCGLAADGALYCWGESFAGEKDGKDECWSVDAGTPCNQRPARMGPFAFRAFSMGLSHMCGIAADGGVVCWGYGSYGSLGKEVEVPGKAPLRIALPAEAP